ncbi:MAG: hypothetical protein ACREQN_10905 [Candidatus Binataceae bacterium]
MAAGGQYEQPPATDVTELLPASALSGPGYSVQQQAPTNGAMGQYTIVAGASVFHNSAGTYQVESLDLLKIRLSEIPAIAQQDNMNQSAVFARALASSAVRPVTDAAHMLVHPMGTITVRAGSYPAVLFRVRFQGKIGPAHTCDTQYNFFAPAVGLVAMIT